MEESAALKEDRTMGGIRARKITRSTWMRRNLAVFLISLRWIKGNARGSARLASRSLFARAHARVNTGGEYALTSFALSFEKSLSPPPSFDRSCVVNFPLPHLPFLLFFISRFVTNRTETVEGKSKRCIINGHVTPAWVYLAISAKIPANQRRLPIACSLTI